MCLIPSVFFALALYLLTIPPGTVFRFVFRVTRCSNLAPVRLIHEIQFSAPGGFRIYVFAGGAQSQPQTHARLAAFSKYLSTNPRAFVRRFGARGLSGKVGPNRALPEAMNTGIIGYEYVSFSFLFISTLDIVCLN